MPRVRFLTRIRSLGSGGFSPIEILLAATLLGMLVVALGGAIIYGRFSTASSGDHARAYMLAEEGVEAVHNIRDAGFANLTNGTFGLAKSSSQWALSGSSDVSGIYTRQVTIATVDSSRKSITSTVSWTQNGSTSQVSVTGRLTNWTAALVIPKTWAGVTVAGGYDATGTTNGYRVATQGNYAYLIRNVSAATNLFIINISNPAAPTLAGSLTLANTPTNIYVSGNYAYVSNSSTAGELQIVNVSNPAAPSLTSTYNASGTAGGGLSVFVSGNYAYLGRAANSGSGELTIVNVSNPASPTLAGGYNNNIAMNGVEVSGNYAYLATSSGSAEMLVLNVSNPALPTLAGTFNATGTTAAAGVAVSGTKAFIVAGTLVTAINITTPTAPAQLGTYTLLGTGNGTAVEADSTGNYLFVGSANTTAEFRVLNVATPSSITLAKTLDISGTASTISGLMYNSTLDAVVGAGGLDTQELVTFVKG